MPLDLAYVCSLLAEHRAGTADRSRKVWTVAMFCLWQAITVERSITVDVPTAAVPVAGHRGG